MSLGQTVSTYFLLPGLLLPLISIILYKALSLPLGWVLIPGSIVGYLWATQYRKPPPLSQETTQRYNVIVAGGGISGLCAGVKLSEAGIPFTIFEAGSDAGGTWHHNTYPGCACDVWT